MINSLFQEPSQPNGRSRPRQLGNMNNQNMQAKRKSNQWMEIHKPHTSDKSAFETHKGSLHGHNDFRRHSVAVGSHNFGHG